MTEFIPNYDSDVYVSCAPVDSQSAWVTKFVNDLSTQLQRKLRRDGADKSLTNLVTHVAFYRKQIDGVWVVSLAVAFWSCEFRSREAAEGNSPRRKGLSI